MANIIKLGGGGGSTPVLITKSITQNGTYNASSDNADGYSAVTVAVSGGVTKSLLYTFNLSQGAQWLNTGVSVADIDVFLFERVDGGDLNNQTIIKKDDIAVYTGGADVYTNVYRQNGKDMNVRIYNGVLYVSYGSTGAATYVSNVYSLSLTDYI